MNTENMKLLADSFNQKVNSLNEIYSDINTKMKDLDGTNDIWKGEKQKTFSQYLQLSLNISELLQLEYLILHSNS
jgi:uncharacterized protein YukE